MKINVFEESHDFVHDIFVFDAGTQPLVVNFQGKNGWIEDLTDVFLVDLSCSTYISEIQIVKLKIRFKKSIILQFLMNWLASKKLSQHQPWASLTNKNHDRHIDALLS